ncbi:MAG: DUF2029 domain-containing protein [Planctomycetes bacterium]|nr:DUF2029 domain-containing protein [Planctomycetota bacterium]
MQDGRTPREWSPAGVCILIAAISVAVPLIAVVCLALKLSAVTAGIVALATALITIPFAGRLVPTKLIQGRRTKILLMMWLILSLGASYRIGTMSVFMLDASKTDYAFVPRLREFADPQLAKPFFPKHNCFTSYVIGAYLADQGDENIYASDHYRDAEVETPIHETIGELLTVDRYQYPPPFLLLPHAMLSSGMDFFQMRTVWFAINVALLFLTVAALATWIGGRGFNAYWFAWPLAVLAPVTLATLQMGNAHMFIILISLLAMLAFEKNWNFVGGTLLGYAIVSKLFPGVLLAYLVMRRRWRPTGWTVGMMGVLGCATLAALGAAPFKAFFDYQVPRLASGEAFGFMTTYIRAIVVNLSVMGIPYRLVELGVLADDNAPRIATALVWIHTVLIVAAIAVLGNRHRRAPFTAPAPDAVMLRRRQLACGWTLLLILGELRSPFLPWGYANVPILILCYLLLPACTRVWTRVCLLGGVLMFSVAVPLAYGPTTGTLDLCYALGATLIALALCIGVIWKQKPDQELTTA